jgi:hypothetical protein
MHGDQPIDTPDSIMLGYACPCMPRDTIRAAFFRRFGFFRQ